MFLVCKSVRLVALIFENALILCAVSLSVFPANLLPDISTKPFMHIRCGSHAVLLQISFAKELIVTWLQVHQFVRRSTSFCSMVLAISWLRALA